jgi:hypothetical protein
MKNLVRVLMLIAVLLAPAQVVHAQGDTSNGRLVIGQSFTLSSGQTVDGDLVVIGGTATIEDGAVVKGDVVVIGGSLRMDGQTTGSAVVIGGAASVGPNGSVASDLITLGGNLQHDAGARIGGDIITNLPLPSAEIPRIVAPSAPPAPPQIRLPFERNPFGTAAGILLQSLGLAALAMLLTVFLHPQLDRVAQAVAAQPFLVGSIGLLVTVVAPIAIVVLAVTLILIPVALAAVILLVLAWLFGVVALGMLVGDRLTLALHRNLEPVLSAGLGALLLGIVVASVQHIPCVGWIAALLVGLIGLGAAVITVFGTRPMYQKPLPVVAAGDGSAGASPIPPPA